MDETTSVTPLLPQNSEIESFTYISDSLLPEDEKKSYFLTPPSSSECPLNNNTQNIPMDDLYMHDMKPQLVEYKFEQPDMILDMDKSIHIEELKSSSSFNGDGLYQNQYLSTVDTTELSNPSSDLREEHMGLRPTKFEECDFNSSDSFSSTESIIPKTIECPKCPKRFMFKSDLMRHDRHKHKTKQRLQCLVCQKSFPNQQSLEVHEKCHQQGNYKCRHCNRGFKKVVYLNKHMELCPVVAKVPATAIIVEENVVVEKPPEPVSLIGPDGKYHCRICVKNYESKRGLMKHMKKHETSPPAERPYQCDLCSVTCSSRGNLRLHQQKHSDLRPHDCGECDKSFKSPRDLKRHMLKHSDERPFQCTIGCTNKTFKVVGDLKRHLQRAHPNATYDNATNSIKINYTLTQDALVDNSVLDGVTVFPENGVLNVLTPLVLTPVDSNDNVASYIISPSNSTVIPLSTISDVSTL